MYKFNLLNKHVFQVYHVREPRWASLLYVFIHIYTSAFVALYGASPTRTWVPLEQKSAPKSGLAHFTNAFTPVNLLHKNMESEAGT